MTALCLEDEPAIEPKQKAIMTAMAKRTLPCLEMARGISCEIEMVLSVSALARQVINLFRMLLCRNSQTQPSSKGVKIERFLRLFLLKV